MVTQEEITRLLAVIAAAYPAFKVENVVQVKIWYESLKDCNYDQIKMAIQKHIIENKWPPSIAEIREGVVNISNPEIPAKDEAWGEVMQAMQKFGVYRAKDAMESMHPVVAATAKRMGWREMCHGDNIGVVRGQFLKMYEIIERREKTAGLMPRSLAGDIANMRALKAPNTKQPQDIKSLAQDLGDKFNLE